MNRSRPLLSLATGLYRLGLESRLLLPTQRCRTFGCSAVLQRRAIARIYIINMDRMPGRLTATLKELAHVRDRSGVALSECATRIRAVDAMQLDGHLTRIHEVTGFYTLRDQLAVEPQPRILPDQFELDRPIRMSLAEVAVARSHILAWRAIATGNCEYSLVLEDDVWFRATLGQTLDRAWKELEALHDAPDGQPMFDVLYLSYKEVTGGAPKLIVSSHVFRPFRGLWYLSGYVLSRQGARTLLERLPCRGPVDLWMNLQFEGLDVKALRRSVIEQRRDFATTNDYSVLPTLSKVGVIDAGGAALFRRRPAEEPVFAIGQPGSGLTSLAMALSLLGYTCCSDLESLPSTELDALLCRRGRRRFNAYVNIGALDRRVEELHALYPRAKFIVLGRCEHSVALSAALGRSVAFLQADEEDNWRVLCEHLRCPPPLARYPALPDLGQQSLQPFAPARASGTALRSDTSPWVIARDRTWNGVHVHAGQPLFESSGDASFDDPLGAIDHSRWFTRSDTFPGNLGLFRPSNVRLRPQGGLLLRVTPERLGVRDYSAGALSSRSAFLHGRFEVRLMAAGAHGIVTGFFLHRDSPRQEIDVEIRGNRPSHMLVNVFFNPGGDGDRFDYGYRGTPVEVPLGFDASRSFHRYAIEWTPTELRWLVDDRVLHRRGVWDPTPIPQLPMGLHLNTWPTRSRELAGRLRSTDLPIQTEVTSIRAQALAPRESRSSFRGTSRVSSPA